MSASAISPKAINMMKAQIILFAMVFSVLEICAAAAPVPVTYAIVRLNHDHARGFIPSASSRQDIRLVGIAEPNHDLAGRYASAYKLSTNLFFTSLEEMLDKARPQAVA